ncbi:hypothetical protein Rcae01_05937 [Novipirellula caenicola]|uniref:Gfo/Idh/MocA-like oxidoreductase C-terminal domain-containing protein n=2 Tax=Novipirellula caenicola TaxID=1536901 RepID=A0ABP9VZ67_9BACT
MVREYIRSSVLGKLVSFNVENGYDYAWSSASNFILSKAQAGGGVLMGLGSHVLDSLIWMLGDPIAFEFECDSEGGIESECKVHLTMAGGAKGCVELSRSRNLENRYLFEFEKGTIYAPFYGDNVSVSLAGSELTLNGRSVPAGSPYAEVQSVAKIMSQELDDFADAVIEGKPPMATGEDAMKSIALIDGCYASPKILDFPWMQPIEGTS